ARAEARLEEAARSAGIADPRPPLRERLRTLRETRRPDFDRAIEHYEKHVLPALAGADPLAAWIEYGRFLAGIDGDGKVVTIDERGRAADWVADTPHGLVLFIPDDLAVAVLAL